ncbi:hypothetical protein HXZ93_06790 [Acinetobacter pseudolwoffii]|uniref:hypothetical protein n=1 Tax=Acinetobacter pseudolwoffii TaxID=2053287 RepID=UPI002578DDBA|nr:hypothetical protein [Acinetobacter pseudolwoffii]MDM1335741.1 hypothetical protein [Acinetobacter pseudolwoffii]
MGNIYFSFPNELLSVYDVDQEISIINEGVCYPFSLKLNEKSNKLIVFLPGAFNKNLSNEVKFQRSSYFSELSENCISFFDPTLFLNNDIGIGWFQGEKNKDYIVFVAKILLFIVDQKKINSSDIVFFSTSAGGIPAFRLASYFEDCIVYAGNIQTDFLKYYKGARDRIIQYTYLNDTIEQISMNFANRSNIFNIDEKFKVIYTQNISDDFHYKNHFLPYLDLSRMKSEISYEIFEYKDNIKGHSPLGKEKEILIINSILRYRSIDNIVELLGFVNVN